MEKYKTILKMENIKKNLEEGKRQEALAIAEKIELRKIKNLSDLGLLAECYFQNGIYDQAREIFLRIYEQNPSRRVTSQMVHISIKLNNMADAEYYLKEFIKLAPDDFYRYIFQYSIDKQKKEPISTLIDDLVHLKNVEYIESWAYELAKLYHKAGKKEECIEECENIILWFGSGEYVDRARALKAYYLGELDEELINSDKAESTALTEEQVTEEHQTEEENSVSDENPIEDESHVEENQDQQSDSEISNIQAEEEQQSVEEQEQISESESNKELSEDNNSQAEPIIEQEESRKEEVKQDTVEKVTYPVPSNEELISSEEFKDLLSCITQKKVSLGLMLGNYARIPKITEQIIRSLDLAMTQSSEHITFVITGDSDYEMTGLAKRLSKVCAYLGFSDSRRLALVHGEKLNHIDLLDKLSQLRECALVIEHASQMEKTSVDMIKQLNEVIDTRIIIIIEDTRKNMDKFLSAHPSLTSMFTNRIHLSELTKEAVMGYLYDYITERDYEVEQTAFDMIQKKVETLLLEHKDKVFEQIIPEINQIMQNAKNRSTRQLMEMSQSGKYVPGELMMVRKADVID